MAESVAIVWQISKKVAKVWQFSEENQGRSGNENLVPKRDLGNMGNPLEETFNSSGITKEAKASFFCA